MHDDLDFMLFDALRQAGRSMRAQRPRADDSTCTPTLKREIILAILLDNEGGLRQNQLASAFRVSPSTLSEMLNKLETDGMISRTSDPADRRATLLTLTEKGSSRAAEIKEETRRAFAETFGSLTDDEKQTLITLLRKIPAQDQT